MKILDIPIKHIEIQENVRLSARDSKLTELMESIKQHGLKQAVGLGKIDNTHYTLIYGSRRLEACKKLGWKSIPASVEDNPELVELFTVNMIENLHRQDISPAELGRMCLKLQKLELTDSEIATRLSIPVGRVREAMTIFKQVPEGIRKRIKYMPYGRGQKEGQISASLATSVINIRKVYTLSEKQFSDLLEHVRKEELCMADLNIVAALMKSGMTLGQAVAERKKYSTYRVNIVVDKTKIKALAKKAGLNENAYLKGVCYGTYPAVSKPVFINLNGK